MVECEASICKRVAAEARIFAANLFLVTFALRPFIPVRICDNLQNILYCSNQPAPSPAPAASRPTRERNPPDFLSPKMSGQYHGREMTFTCDIYLVEIADNVSGFFDDMVFLLTLADKNMMTLKDALNEPDAEEFEKHEVCPEDTIATERLLCCSVMIIASDEGCMLERTAVYSVALYLSCR